MTYHIVFLEDVYECETCGYNYAQGYIIEKDGVVVVDKTPVAHCYSPTEYPQDGAYFDIFQLENIEVTTNYSNTEDEDE